MRADLAVFADACCVLAFVVIGRASHSDGETLAGAAGDGDDLRDLAAGAQSARKTILPRWAISDWLRSALSHSAS